MSTSYLTLEDPNGNVYSFPFSIWLKGEPVSTNKNVVNRTYAAGGKNKADGFLGPKTLSLGGSIYADSLALLETKKRNFVKACLKGGKLRYSDDYVSRFIEVSAPDFELSNTDNRYEVEVNIDFLAELPFWQDYSLTTTTAVVTGDDTFTVDNSGSDFVVMPTVEVENDQGEDNPGLMLRNSSDGGMQIIYNDNLFIEGDLLIINSDEGTIRRNNNSSIENVAGIARFLRLQPAINTFYYEGAACTIRVKFRKVYLI